MGGPNARASSTTAIEACSISLIRYTDRLAETINGLYKTEVIRPNAPWHGIEEVEFATLEWVDWFNNRRLLEPIGNIPPVEFEAMYAQTQESPTTEAGLN